VHGIDNPEITEPLDARRAPMIAMTKSLSALKSTQR
jgi:hypothetical protein